MRGAAVGEEGRERKGAVVEGECEVDCRVLVSVDGGGSLFLQGGDVWFGRCFSTCRSHSIAFESL
jgi:hypothetical protein